MGYHEIGFEGGRGAGGGGGRRGNSGLNLNDVPIIKQTPWKFREVLRNLWSIRLYRNMMQTRARLIYR